MQAELGVRRRIESIQERCIETSYNKADFKYMSDIERDVQAVESLFTEGDDSRITAYKSKCDRKLRQINSYTSNVKQLEKARRAAKAKRCKGVYAKYGTPLDFLESDRAIDASCEDWAVVGCRNKRDVGWMLCKKACRDALEGCE